MSMIQSSCALLGSQVGGQLRHRQVQHRQVHRVQQAGQREHGQPDPFAPAGFHSSTGRGQLVVFHASEV